MSKIHDPTSIKSIWKPQFIEEINRDLCLDCDRFYEIGGRNALKLKPIDNSNHQVMTVANPEQCADCDACTSIYPEKAYTHYSFSI